METNNSLKEILSSKENFDKLIKIAENFGIVGRYGEGVNKLDEIFEKVFTGELLPEKVKEEIKKSFGFGDELCNDIANEMEKEIFSNYKKEIEEIYSAPSELKIPKETKEEKLEKPEKDIPPQENIPPQEKITSQKQQEPAFSQSQKPENADDVNQILKELEEEIGKEKTNEL